MGMIEEIKGKTIFIDTAPLIYYIEGSSKYQKILNKLFDLNVKKHFELITSKHLIQFSWQLQ
jgi:chitinase